MSMSKKTRIVIADVWGASLFHVSRLLGPHLDLDHRRHVRSHDRRGPRGCRGADGPSSATTSGRVARARSPTGRGAPRAGRSTDPRGGARTGPRPLGAGDPDDPAASRSAAGAAPSGTHPAGRPARPRRGGARRRCPRGRDRPAADPGRARRRRGADPARARRRVHGAPDRRMGDPAGLRPGPGDRGQRPSANAPHPGSRRRGRAVRR